MPIDSPARARTAAAPAAYRHVQLGKPVILGGILGFIAATILAASLSNPTLQALPGLVLALFAVLALGCALFYRLVTEVDARHVRAIFGVGLVRKSVEIADIRRVDIVRTRFWWGWGIHWTPAGWLYNVAGRRAVRLELASERALMIGTDEPEALKAAIEARLAAAGKGR